jgi:hypothetical protein
MRNTVKGIRESQDWHRKFGPLAPKVGDMASDFEIRDASCENTVRLSDFRGSKPVALIFGSFT